MILKNILTSFTLLLGLNATGLVHAQNEKIFDIQLKQVKAASVTTRVNSKYYRAPKGGDSEEVTLKKYLGEKPIYLKFWASWCQECLKQMPHFQHTYETYSEDVAIISVNLGVNETEQAIANVQQKYSLTVPTVIDESGKLAQGVNLIGTPYHVLIDLDGNIVFKGHDVSEKLNNTLKLLASSNSVTLPTITVKDHIEQSVIKQHAPLTALFFTSTWCDWYLKKSRPAISQNCVMGQQYVNALAQQTPQFNWLGVISHLWTGEKEMIEYQEKYQISYPMLIDSQEHAFVQYQVKDYPTLILLKDGQEVYRVSDFSEITEISKSVLAFN